VRERLIRREGAAQSVGVEALRGVEQVERGSLGNDAFAW
jgi:hypothetical protein